MYYHLWCYFTVLIICTCFFLFVFFGSRVIVKFLQKLIQVLIHVIYHCKCVANQHDRSSRVRFVFKFACSQRTFSVDVGFTTSCYHASVFRRLVKADKAHVIGVFSLLKFFKGMAKALRSM